MDIKEIASELVMARIIAERDEMILALFNEKAKLEAQLKELQEKEPEKNLDNG